MMTMCGQMSEYSSAAIAILLVILEIRLIRKGFANTRQESPMLRISPRGGKEMISRKPLVAFLLFLGVILSAPSAALSQGEILEFHCPSCGYRERLVQGSDESERTRNIQNIIVVCERSGQIRSIKVPLDPNVPSQGEPLLARQYGTGQSELLGVKLPKFLVPGNTCPLFPVTPYLERNICPVDGSQGIQYSLVGSY